MKPHEHMYTCRTGKIEIILSGAADSRCQRAGDDPKAVLDLLRGNKGSDTRKPSGGILCRSPA